MLDFTEGHSHKVEGLNTVIDSSNITQVSRSLCLGDTARNE